MNTTFEQKIRFNFLIFFATAITMFSYKETLAQTNENPYSTLWKGKNKWIYGGIALHAGINFVAEKSLPETQLTVRHFKLPLDRLRPVSLNPKAAHLSDGIIAGNFCLGLAASFINVKSNKAMILTEISQSTFITLNLCKSVKMSVNRGRPYTYGQPAGAFTSRNDVYSFFSGHSSASAAVSTTLWLNRSKISSNQKLNYVICGTSSLMTLSTALLRIKAHKHYPSDVLTGAITGAGISLLMHQIQRKG